MANIELDFTKFVLDQNPELWGVRTPANEQEMFNKFAVAISDPNNVVAINAYSGLLEKVARSFTEQSPYTYNMGVMYRGTEEYGAILEEYYESPIKSDEWDLTGQGESGPYLLGRKAANTKVAWYKKAFQHRYKKTIPNAELRGGVTSREGFDRFNKNLIISMDNAYSIDFDLQALEMLSANNGRYPVVECTDFGEVTTAQDKRDVGAEFVNIVKRLKYKLEWTNNFNMWSVANPTDKIETWAQGSKKLVLFINSDVLSYITSYTYSGTFNKDELIIPTDIEIVSVPNFGSRMKGCYAILADRDTFRICPQINVVGSQYVITELYTNLFHNVNGFALASPFKSVVAIGPRGGELSTAAARVGRKVESTNKVVNLDTIK